MEWVYLSVLSGFGQALGWALKKKSLENKGVNNILGLISFFVAGVILTLLWLSQTNSIIPLISERFIVATSVVVILNVLAVWTAYRALDKSALSQLMPFIALSSIVIIPVEYVLRGILPTNLQIIGIIFVTLGAIISALREKITKESLVVAGYFGVTLVCYSITSPFMAVMVEESSSGLFSGAVVHLGIAIGFLFLAIGSRELIIIRALRLTGEWPKIFMLMMLTGIVIAVLENGPANIALETGSASEVFALKRTMPFFALILGVLLFKEKIMRRHIIGTALLVFGSMMIIWFQ